MEFQKSSKAVQTTRQEIIRLTFATLALLIAGLLTSPALEKPTKMARTTEESIGTPVVSEKTPSQIKGKNRGGRAMAQFNIRRP